MQPERKDYRERGEGDVNPLFEPFGTVTTGIGVMTVGHAFTSGPDFRVVGRIVAGWGSTRVHDSRLIRVAITSGGTSTPVHAGLEPMASE